MFRIGNFGAAPRYSVHVLPALALLLGRAVEPWWEGKRTPVFRLLAILSLAAWVATRQSDQGAILFFLIAYATVAIIAWIRPGALAVTLVAVLAAVGPLLPVRFEVGRSITASYLDPVVRWLQSHPAEANAPIYTNSQLLAPFLELRGRSPEGGVVFVAGVNMSHELSYLTNGNNGQRERLEHLAATDLYGKTIVAPVMPDDLTAGALLVMRVESRLPLLFPDEVWGPRLEVIADSQQYRIARLRPPDTAD
jgi:hypothetical protein